MNRAPLRTKKKKNSFGPHIIECPKSPSFQVYGPVENHFNSFQTKPKTRLDSL